MLHRCRNRLLKQKQKQIIERYNDTSCKLLIKCFSPFRSLWFTGDCKKKKTWIITYILKNMTGWEDLSKELDFRFASIDSNLLVCFHRHKQVHKCTYSPSSYENMHIQETQKQTQGFCKKLRDFVDAIFIKPAFLVLAELDYTKSILSTWWAHLKHH